MMKRFYFLILFGILLTLSVEISAMERRKDQFYKESSYLVFPLLYSLPGIGSGVVVTGYANNLFGTYTDAYGLLIFGEAEGMQLGVEDIHLISERLILDLGRQDINKALVNNYEKRGMDTDKDDYNLLEVSKADGSSGVLTLTFFDRMFEVFTSVYAQESEIEAVRDPDGNIIVELEEPIRGESENYQIGSVLDYTDDRQDPRKGIRFEVALRKSPRQDEDDPDFYVLNHNATLHIPIGRLSTWAFNYFRSDAFVTSEGETNPDTIREDLGFGCDPSDTECLKAEQEVVDTFIAANKYGTATSLGGERRLRSYPGNRFQGAHTQFFGTEFRWNLTEGFTPFDYYIWKDVRTNVQLAFFAEMGRVAEESDDLWGDYRSSYGVGIRMLTGSGIVYRMDIAAGDEGIEYTIIFSYPW
jgi:hypothetical protein